MATHFVITKQILTHDEHLLNICRMISKCDINENNSGVAGCTIARRMSGVHRNNIGGGYKNIMKHSLTSVISVTFGNYTY